LTRVPSATVTSSFPAFRDSFPELFLQQRPRTLPRLPRDPPAAATASSPAALARAYPEGAIMSSGGVGPSLPRARPLSSASPASIARRSPSPPPP
jgi:hypothetical protein